MADYKDAYENRIFGPMGTDRVTRPASATPKYGIPPGGGRAVRLQLATLERVPREEANMGYLTETEETEEQLGYRAAYVLTNIKRFANWSTWGSSGTKVDSGLTFELVKTLEDDRARDSYGESEYSQGSEGVIGHIFKVTDNDTGRTVHLRKEGWANSYGTEQWDGPLRIVKPKTKTVIEYEY